MSVCISDFLYMCVRRKGWEKEEEKYERKNCAEREKVNIIELFRIRIDFRELLMKDIKWMSVESAIKGKLADLRVYVLNIYQGLLIFYCLFRLIRFPIR